MSFVSVDEYQRFGLRINGDMHALDANVDMTGATKLGGPWWQNWKGFLGSWSQYYNANVEGTQGLPGLSLLPIHDDSDLHDWATKLDDWRNQYASLSKVNVGPLITQETNQQILPGVSDVLGTGPTSPYVKIAMVLAGVFGVGYLVSSSAKLIGR